MHTLANANVSANLGVSRHKADVQYVTRMFVFLTDFNSYAKRVTRICFSAWKCLKNVNSLNVS